MKRSHVFILSLLSALVLILLHLGAVSLRLYWTIWWLDLVFHFWGGIIVGSIAISLFLRRSDPLWRALTMVSGMVLAVALAWEAHELVTRTFYATDYVLDTIADLMLGLAGGLTAFLVAQRALNKNKRYAK